MSRFEDHVRVAFGWMRRLQRAIREFPSAPPSTNVDVIEKRRADEVLRNFRLIVDSIPAPVAIMTPAGEVEVVNRLTLEYFGKTLDELKGWSTADAVHPDDLPQTVAAWIKAVETGQNYEIESRHRRADGVYRWFHVHGFPLRDTEGRIIRWCVLQTDVEDRKQAEAALRSSEANFKSIINTLPTTAWSTRSDGYCDFLNTRWLDYAGFTAEQAQGWGWGAVIHPDDVDRLVQYWQACLASGTPVDTEARMRRFDGAYRWFLFRANPLRDSSGNIIKWYGTNVDIEDRRRADEALRASERKLNQIINTIPALAWSARPDGSAEFFNRHYLDYVGMFQEQMQDWGWTAAVHPDDLSALSGAWQSIVASNAPGECEARLRRFDGEYRWFLFRTNPQRDEAGNIVKWYGTNTDIDDRKRVEEKLRRNEAFLAEGQRLSSVGSFSWRLDTDEITFSEELHRIFEIEREAPVTLERIASKIHPEDGSIWSEMVKRSRDGNTEQEYEIRLLMPEERVKYLHTISRGITHQDGRLEVIGAAQDVTQRRLSEEALAKVRSELAHVSRITSLGMLAASIAHEVNQPVSSILMNGETSLRWLAKPDPDLEEIRELTTKVVADARRVSEIIDRTRSMATRRVPQPGPLSLGEIVEQSIVLLRHEFQSRNISVSLDLMPSLPRIVGDRTQLQQVIVNLVMNAAQAVEQPEATGRCISVRTIQGVPETVCCSVEDSGPGIDPTHLPRLFDSFFTTKNTGMGMGLPICRSIIEAHDGRILADNNSALGGARFRFALPASHSN